MIYILSCGTFSGKTAYLRTLMNDNPQKKSKYFTDEEWAEFIISLAKQASCTEYMNLGGYDIICIDNIDFLQNCKSIQEITAKIIAELKDKVDFYLSGIKLDERITTLIDTLKNDNVPLQYITP